MKQVYKEFFKGIYKGQNLGVFYRIIGYGTNGLKLTLKNDEVVCDREEQSDADLWKFVRESRKRKKKQGWPGATAGWYLQNRNGKNLGWQNMDGVIEVFVGDPKTEDTRLKEWFWQITKWPGSSNWDNCTYVLRDKTGLAAVLSFEEDSCKWVGEPIINEGFRTILVKDQSSTDPTDTPTTTTTSTTENSDPIFSLATIEKIREMIDNADIPGPIRSEFDKINELLNSLEILDWWDELPDKARKRELTGENAIDLLLLPTFPII